MSRKRHTILGDWNIKIIIGDKVYKISPESDHVYDAKKSVIVVS